MTSKLAQPWIPLDKVEELVQIEPALVILGLCLLALVFYKLLLKEVSEERHRNLKRLFRNLFANAAAGCILFFAYYGLHQVAETSPPAARLLPYVGLLTVFTGAMAFVKVSRIIMFEYLFVSHLREAVPLLLVNLFTLLMSVVLSAWIATEVFSIRLAPLLATSAIFSLVVGLALQDTLGNLFAGVALQFDKPYEIGDWIEVHYDGEKWVGQVVEISWRATLLQGFAEESITIPNRIIAQSQISNWATRQRPIIRSQIFRIPYGTPHDQVQAALLEAGSRVPALRKNPAPFVMVTESTDACLLYKLVYYIDNFGAQYPIADQVIRAVIEALARRGCSVAPARIVVARQGVSDEVTAPEHEA